MRAELADLRELLKSDVPWVKPEFRRLNLALTFTPVEAQPRPHYVVKGQCDLSALVFSFVRPSDWSAVAGRARSNWQTQPSAPQGASLDWMLEQLELATGNW